ncbi:MAG: amidase [Ignavibacteriales bacterium UTCHB2]|nr:MAG: Stage II sporulation protein [Ignavibacteria bacterium ADurb.Bin266]OQY74040.1 MAG: amidase [Ignavibacteriales bacterium UTCHB2]
MLGYEREPHISVGILTEKKIRFELHGDFSSYGFKHFFSGRFEAEIINNNIICKGDKDKLEITDEIIFEPQEPDNESFLIRDVTIGVKFHWERKEKQRFTHSLKLIKDGDKIAVINIIPIEKYLMSVISSEMSAKCSLSMLKATAVVSRSWLLAQIEKSKRIKTEHINYHTTYQTEDEYIKWYDREDHKLFDVCADDHCQRYQGVTKMTSEAVKKAVEQTAGIVLLEGDKILDARFSKSCGGISESFENVWEPVKHPSLSSIYDYKFVADDFDDDFSKEENAAKWIKASPPAFCNTTDQRILNQILLDYDQETKDFYRWKVEYTQQELSELIKKKSGIDFGLIKDLIPVERGFSSRLIKLKIVGTNKTLTIGKELEIRRTLSETHLYSSAFIIEKEGDVNGVPEKLILRGAGWGHGVGLCQIGAAVMAEQGYQFDEIVIHYFKDAVLKKIY